MPCVLVQHPPLVQDDFSWGEVKSHPIGITPNNLVVVVNVFAALGENVIVTQKFISLLKQISKAYFEILDLTKTVTCSKVIT